jgi:hypothetical protein
MTGPSNISGSPSIPHEIRACVSPASKRLIFFNTPFFSVFPPFGTGVQNLMISGLNEINEIHLLLIYIRHRLLAVMMNDALQEAISRLAFVQVQGWLPARRRVVKAGLSLR